MKHLGWIFDLYPKNGSMIVWLKKPDGSCARLVDEWTPRFHVSGELRDLLDLACQPYLERSRLVERFEKPGDQKKTRVLQVKVDRDSEAAALAKRIQSRGNYSKFRLYDVDIPSAQMYLYRKDLFPLAFVEAEETPGGISWTLKDSRESIEYQLPPLRTLRLEVKTKKKEQIQRLDDELDVARIVFDGGEKLSIDSGDEGEKILRLVQTFQERDPDIVLTSGGDSFIFPFLARRAQKNGILDRLVLGREPSPLKVYEVQGHSYFSYGKILYRDTATRLPGRLHIDEANAYISSDCGLEGLFEVSRTCIIPLQRASRATIGTSMTSLQLYNAVKQGILIPWNKSEPEEFKTAGELVVADRGGFVYEPAMGAHDEIGELDFSSLYPSLMLTRNLSGETVKCQCCPDSTERVPELGYNICQRWQGIVPRSLEILLRKRALFKSLKKEATDPQRRRIFDRRQAALKWILVCCLPFDSPVLILQDGRISYQQIGRVVDRYVKDSIGVVDCPEPFCVAGVDKNLKSKFCNVSKLIKVPSPEKLLRVELEDGRQVKCTSNHSFYVLKGGGLVEVKAENLSRGDLVPVAKHVVKNNVVSSLNLLEQVRKKIDPTENDLWRAKSEGLRPVIDSSSNTLELALKKDRRPVQNLRGWRESGVIPFRYLHLLSFSEDSSELSIGHGRRGGGHVAWLPASLGLDEDLGFFLGFYVADGSAGENFIRLDVGGNETEIIQHLSRIIKKKFGLTPRVYKESKANMYVVQVNSVSLVHILNRVFELPASSSAGKLKVPSLLFNSSQKAMFGFISGLVAGDGSVNKARDNISVATHSYSFAVQVGYLALRLGIPFNILKGRRLHRVYFTGPNGLRPFTKSFLKKSHRTRVEAIRTSCEADCRHAAFEMFPVGASGLETIARVARTVRTPRLEGKSRICPERARESLLRIAKSPLFPRLQEAHSNVERLLEADIGFVAVKEVEEVESASSYVYCFQVSDDGNLPAFFTGSGGVLVHNCFGYLGFKNARFGKIDAHIATCAFARRVLGQAAAIAESRGFKLIHGIVDSMWLGKPGATAGEYGELCEEIKEKLGLPISFEGCYRWIVFLNSKVYFGIPVLNRYYGVFQDGTIKVRGIELRRHDTPGVVRKCQSEMLALLSKAKNSSELRALIPETLGLMKDSVLSLRRGVVPVEDLVIEKNLSKDPGEYANLVPQAVAARHLLEAGGSVHAGQRVNYILTKGGGRRPENRAVPLELANDKTGYDPEKYVDLLVSSVKNILLPFGYDERMLKAVIGERIAPENRVGASKQERVAIGSDLLAQYS